MNKPLRDVDAGERAHRLQALFWSVLPCTLLGGLIAFYLHETRGLGVLGILGVVCIGLVVGLVIAFASLQLAGLAGSGFAKTVLGAGNLAPSPSFSEQESLIARGRYAEAAESFSRHIASHPRDFHARLALAALEAGPLADSPEAEATYLGIRRDQPSEEVLYRVAQALIDLYAKTDQRGKHLAELSRFAERYRETAAGRSAKRALLEIKRGE